MAVQATEQVTQAVIDAIMSGVVNITRRVEIYESDGVTPFAPGNPRLIGGQVTLDATRDERRALDCVLDNSDRALVHNVDGFWYDKIVKVFRGLTFTIPKPEVKVALVSAVDASSYGGIMLRSLGVGYSYITQSTATLTVSDLDEYDIVVFSTNGTATDTLDANEIAILFALWAAGKNVFTIDLSGSDVLALLAATTSATGAGPFTMQPSSTRNVFSNVMGTRQYSSSGGLIKTATLAPGAVAAAEVAGSTGYPAVYLQGALGNRWFHYGAAVTPMTTGPNQYRLYRAALKWMVDFQSDYAYETQVGEFMIDKIATASGTRGQVAVTGRDYTKKLLTSKFDATTSFASGTNIEQVVRAIAANAGVTRFRFEAPGLTMEATLTFDRTAARWEAIKGICAAANLEVFFDAHGYLVVRTFRDPSISPASLSLANWGPDANLIEFSKVSEDTRIYNRVVVTGENDQDAAKGNIWQGIVENRNPSSPTRIAVAGVPGGLNVRTYYYTSQFFTNNQQCLAYAQSLMQVVALEQFTLTFSSLVFPWIEVGEIVEFYDPDDGDFPNRFLMNQVAIPLGLEGMTGTANRVTIVG